MVVVVVVVVAVEVEVVMVVEGWRPVIPTICQNGYSSVLGIPTSFWCSKYENGNKKLGMAFHSAHFCLPNVPLPQWSVAVQLCSVSPSSCSDI